MTEKTEAQQSVTDDLSCFSARDQARIAFALTQGWQWGVASNARVLRNEDRVTGAVIYTDQSGKAPEVTPFLPEPPASEAGCAGPRRFVRTPEYMRAQEMGEEIYIAHSVPSVRHAPDGVTFNQIMEDHVGQSSTDGFPPHGEHKVAFYLVRCIEAGLVGVVDTPRDAGKSVAEGELEAWLRAEVEKCAESLSGILALARREGALHAMGRLNVSEVTMGHVLDDFLLPIGRQ